MDIDCGKQAVRVSKKSECSSVHILKDEQMNAILVKKSFQKKLK